MLIFVSIAAKVKIEPRMGPIQGVQPNPKAAPTSTGKAKLWLYWSVKILISLFINLKLIIPIIGVGGVNSGKSAYEKIRAGASLLQLYTGLVYKGPSIVKNIKKELIQILKVEGLNNIKAAIGKNL